MTIRSFLLCLFAVSTAILLGCAQSEPATITPPATDSPATADPPPVPTLSGLWVPSPKTTWQWQLNGLPLDTSVDVEMYDIDLFDNDAATVAALHVEGRKVVCYMNAGGWKEWRPDAAAFPEAIIGANLDDWEGERWLDIQRIDILAPIMEARMDSCRDKGFDGIETDNIDGYLNDTGFPLDYDDQLEYNIWLAETAHARGLSIGLKNDMDQAPELLAHFDWALNEECFQYEECETLLPFIEAGKAVFNVEYSLEAGEFCAQARDMGFNSLKKNLDVDAWRESCD